MSARPSASEADTKERAAAVAGEAKELVAAVAGQAREHAAAAAGQAKEQVAAGASQARTLAADTARHNPKAAVTALAGAAFALMVAWRRRRARRGKG